MEDRVDRETLASVTRVLMEASGAEAILLFGSRARGDHARHSDYDLCLVMPDATRRGSVDIRRLYGLVRGHDASIDVVAITLSRYLEGAREINSLARGVWRDDVVLAGSVAGRASA